MFTHSIIPATLEEVPIFLAFDHRRLGPLCVMVDGRQELWGKLWDFLPLLPFAPTVRDATRIFARQRFQRDLAGKMTARNYRKISVRFGANAR